MTRLREWWAFIRAHPYADITAVVFFLILGGGGVRVWTRPTVLLSVDGATRKIHPHARTVGETLAQEKIVLGPEDFVTPDARTPLIRNMPVQVTRVTHVKEIQFKRDNPRIYWRVQLKSNLRPVLVERGFVNESSFTVTATLYNGVRVSEKILKRKMKRAPLFTLTLIDSKTGQPEKVYNLAKAKKIVMRATGYYVGEKYVPSDTTFLGYKLRRGLVAVDPKVIPLHTRLYVKGYGYAYAADTGSAIKGNRIDLAVKDHAEEQSFNRQQMTVYILERSRKW
jgi:3D (Asp-Asp-Asp) domain-containing protein